MTTHRRPSRCIVSSQTHVIKVYRDRQRLIFEESLGKYALAKFGYVLIVIRDPVQRRINSIKFCEWHSIERCVSSAYARRVSCLGSSLEGSRGDAYLVLAVGIAKVRKFLRNGRKSKIKRQSKFDSKASKIR